MDKIAFDLVKGKTFLLIFTVAFKNQRRPPGAGFYANSQIFFEALRQVK